MAYIVAEPCINCKFTDCVAVCPVDCFYEGENFLVISPDECIDCGACEPECPVSAIFEEDDLPDWLQGLRAGQPIPPTKDEEAAVEPTAETEMICSTPRSFIAKMLAR